MPTPKLLCPTERRIYHPELTTCPSCARPTQLLNYLITDKTIQTLTETLSVAARPSHCPDPTCPGFALRLRSVAALHLTLPGTTYGLDVIARLGHLRHHAGLPFAEVHTALAGHVQISRSQIRTLYQEAYLPLLAAADRTHHAALTHLAEQEGGLLLALDGLAPAGGEPQLWCVYELHTGLLLRAGWLSQYDHTAFAAFLQPLAATWPVRAVLSDKQQGLEAAIAAVFPTAAHQLCQAHYLCRLADPVAVADMDLAMSVRKAVRHSCGVDLRAEPTAGAAPSGVLTVTGLLPNPPVGATGAAVPPGMPAPLPDPATALVGAILQRVRYLLTLTTHSPHRFAGLEVVDGLTAILALGTQLLTHRTEARLAALVAALGPVVATVQAAVGRLRQAVAWLGDIQALLDPTATLVLSGAGVAASLSAYLERIDEATNGDPFLTRVVAHWWGVSRRYWPGLFHTYDQAGLPRTNNGLESRFREIRRRLIRTNGQAGQTARQLERVGAWEMVAGAATETAQVAAFAAVAPADWAQERTRLHQHQARFRLHQRNAQRAERQLETLRQAWFALPADPTG